MAKEYNQEASKRMIEYAKGGQLIRNEISANADPNYRDADGYSALDYATGAVSKYNSMQGNNIAALVQAGADPYAQGPDGKSPFERMVEEVREGGIYDGAGAVILNAIHAAEERKEPRPEGFIESVRHNKSPQKNHIDGSLSVMYLRDMVKDRNEYLAKEAAEGRSVEVQVAPTGPREKWTDSVQTVSAGFADKLGGTITASTRDGVIDR